MSVLPKVVVNTPRLDIHAGQKTHLIGKDDQRTPSQWLEH